MSSRQKGKLVLKAVEGGSVEQRVVSYLSRLVKNATPELLTSKVRKAPVILSKNISAEQGLKVAAALESLGASAVFVPHKAEGPKQAPATKPTGPSVPGKPHLPQKPPPVPGPPPIHRQRKWIRLAFASILLVFSLSFLTWRLYPRLAYRGYGPEEEQATARMPRIDFSAYRADKERSPSVMQVAPEDMYQAFVHQYRLRPDTRFIKAFEILAERFVEYRGGSQGQSPYRAGEVLSNGKEILVPLLKQGKVVAEIRMPLPITFSRAMSALNEWVETMEQGKAHPGVKISRIDSWKEFGNANAIINMVDPRAIIEGLIQLEALRHKVGLDPKILRAAARGYAMLLMVLVPDRMDYTDILAAHALSFLTLAKRIDPDLPLASEEALLAMNMGYTAHATALRSIAGSPDPQQIMLEAYIQKDLQTLKSLQGQASEVLAAYLLVRLYREMGLYQEAEKASANLLDKYPGLYPMIVETIWSGKLTAAKSLTVLYPLDILARLENVITPGSLEDKKSWQERIKGLAGEQSAGDISLTRFETLLEKWQPLGPNSDKGFLIDEKRVKVIFRTLYSDAIFLRFDVLLDRWGVAKKAENYAKLLAAKDKRHPMVMEMVAEVHARLGRRNQADVFCSMVIKHPDASAMLAAAAHYNVNNYLDKIRLTSAAVHKIDGRPKNFFLMGTIFQNNWNYDLSEKHCSLGLARNPYWYRGYKYLAEVTGSDEPLSSAIMRFPFSFTLMEEGGDYFAAKDDPASKGKALEYYDRALELVPTRESLPRKKAKVLRQLNHHYEAVQIYKDWIEKHSQNDLTTLAYKAMLAKTYLEMDKPILAVETVADHVASYKADVMMVGARAYEETGQTERAEQIYSNAVNRYPTVDHVLSGTAAFFWRQGRSEEAAKLIAQGRKSMDDFSQWYFDDFLEVFVQAPKERIAAAVGFLVKHGAGNWEISSLGFRFHKNKRPRVAYNILQKANAQEPMEHIEISVGIYEVLCKWKGKAKALEYLHQAVPPQMRTPLVMVLFKRGMFDLILTEIDDPGVYPPRHREFIWLQRLIAWLALEKTPADLEEEMIDHYVQGWQKKLIRKLPMRNPFDYYKDIGRYLLGMISRDELLSLIGNSKQRCEFAYYIGLGERLKANFPEAADWYNLCRETLLENNGEFHWASTELFWWAHMGTRNRHRLPSGDTRAYHAR